MDKLRCCVIDDEPLAAQLIESYVERTPFLELAGVFSSAQDAIKTVLTGNVGLIFLDIQMPQLNGMEFARVVPPHCQVVFTTAFDSYAIDGFKVNALDYLLKPISYEEFLSAATKAYECAVEKEKPIGDTDRYIIVKSEYKLIQIPVKDILYIEGLKDYVKICLDGESKSVMTLMNVKTLEHALPSDMFMRVHRSFIVNTSKIRVIERNRIVFGSAYIPVSESYKQAFTDFVNARLIGMVRTAQDVVDDDM